jgi:3-oxoacyl-[acyl-carrier-protein] synthase-3
MAGQDVFKFAVRSVPSVIEAALKQAGLEKEQVDWLVMHQANQRILDAAATRLGLPAERVSGGLGAWKAYACSQAGACMGKGFKQRGECLCV